MATEYTFNEIKNDYILTYEEMNEKFSEFSSDKNDVTFKYDFFVKVESLAQIQGFLFNNYTEMQELKKKHKDSLNNIKKKYDIIVKRDKIDTAKENNMFIELYENLTTLYNDVKIKSINGGNAKLKRKKATRKKATRKKSMYKPTKIRLNPKKHSCKKTRKINKPMYKKRKSATS